MTSAPPAPRLPPDTVMARVGDDTVTAGDVEQALAGMRGEARFEFTSEETLTELVWMLIDRRLMAAAAQEAGLADDPGVKNRLAGLDPDTAAYRQVLADAWLERELAAVAEPGDADVTRYYQEHRADFREPARVLVTRAVARSPADAERLRVRLTKGIGFAELKADPAPAMRIDQLWLQQVPKAPALTRVALGLAKGEVSPVVPAGERFAVLRAEDTVPPRQRPKAEVAAGIRAALMDRERTRRAATARETLRRNARITLDEAAVRSYLEPAIPVADPPGTD